MHELGKYYGKNLPKIKKLKHTCDGNCYTCVQIILRNVDCRILTGELSQAIAILRYIESNCYKNLIPFQY